MTLLDWHKKLSSHFEALARERLVAQRRVFVLEHGLNAEEIRELQAAVRTAAASRSAEARVSLPWIVYATELGYRFSGDEYWQTFEEKTPGWEFGERTWIREQFLWFHRKFQGIRPTGPWAQHRSIICWPISNAVLPSDLQLQLARILFEMRYALNADLFGNPEKLGREIADRSWSASARLQNLCEEPLLIGQIGAALLLEGQTAAASLILPATLRRIAADLSREQQGREWLKTARGVAVERARVRGVAPIRDGRPAESGPDKAAEEIRTLLLEPRLVLRPTEIAGTWNVGLQLPNMTPLVERLPQARAILTESRCEVAGSSGRPLARGRLLQGVQHVSLSKWPQPGQPLLAFEKKDAHLDYVMRNCFAMPGPGPWLFRIASDGIGYALKSTAVRAGQTYLLLSGDGVGPNVPSVRPIDIRCEGIGGVMLEIPSKLEQSYLDALKSASVVVAPNIRAWPAGTAALEWDGEGRSEWLATEQPMFGITAEAAVVSLLAKMNERQFDLGGIPAGGTVFVGCQQLNPGRHEIELLAKYGPFGQEVPLGRLDLYIRAQRAWEGGRGTQGPLLVDVEPFNATLEQLRAGKVQLTIRGPRERELDVVARMFQGGNDTPIFNRRLPKLTVPLTPEAWTRYVQKNLLEVQEVADLYDIANLCDIDFNGGDLGNIALRFERESVPVRWAVRKAGGRKRQISVVSEAVGVETVEVESRVFENPDVEGAKDRVVLNSWTDIPPKGGLLVARVGQFAAAIVLPPEVHDLRDLRAAVSIKEQPRTLQSAMGTLQTIALWASARLSGSFLSGTRQRAVLRALALHLHAMLCGETWGRIERSIDDPGAALRLLVSKPQELEIAKAIMEELPRLLEQSQRERIEWLYDKVRRPLNLVRVHQVRQLRDGSQRWTTTGDGSPIDPVWLIEFALRLASDPAHVEAWGRETVRPAVEKLLAQPAICRMARLLVILVDQRSSPSNQGIGQLYSGWTW